MRFVFTIMVLFALCLATSAGVLMQAGSCQSMGNFQSVGGDFGKSWINNFMAQNQPAPAQTQNLKNDLWSWGSAPKGSTIVGGKLTANTNTTSAVNISANWLGDSSMPMQKPLILNSSSPYGNYGVAGAPLTPQYLSDDPWVLAQQLDRPVVTSSGPGGMYPTVI
ncbi:MAG TPA: hypothetical protein VN455_06715 [Methanotrichaceae archaeon]|nr:hypothetical protein [Methanotrichaceae archaeon]